MVVNLEGMMKKKEVKLGGDFEEDGDGGVIGDGGEEARPPELGGPPSPAAWPERRR